jgi:mono/diheme cytochrome c family protein
MSLRNSRTLLSLLVLVAAALVVVFSTTFAQNGAASQNPEGAELYMSYCAACHMSDGRGAEGAGRYPNLAGNPTVEASADFVILRILKGYGAMPPFAGSLDNDQVAAIVNHVRGTLNASADVIDGEAAAKFR